jgi:phosphoribosylaminoimidazole-succinocarboxamide synthase
MSKTLAELRPALMEASAPGLRVFSKGKVRDTFELPPQESGSPGAPVGDRLLMVASDRISAFDVVLPTGIPDKGAILTQMSRWWFDRTASTFPNHVVADAQWPEELRPQREAWEPRSMIVRRAARVDIECVVRGYLAGSGWQEYRELGTLAGIKLPPGLGESERLPEPQFTPSTKNEVGHDENITIERMAGIVGAEVTRQLEQASLELYRTGAAAALERGVILADTKFEFGFIDDRLHLIDECFTPDSSRYWDANIYQAGKPQPALDKQFLRDYLETLDWDKTAPGPQLPDDIVLGVRERYMDAYRRITGSDFD